MCTLPHLADLRPAVPEKAFGRGPSIWGPVGSPRPGFSLQEEKNRQLYIILAIIVSVFSACAFVLIIYMLFFPR
jgi:hypothetical protein